MVLACYKWLLHLFKKIMGDHNINAADDNKWSRLIFASSSSSGSPVIPRCFCCSGNCCSPEHLRISIIDGQSEKECRIKGLKSIQDAYFVGCCNGLALFHSTSPSSLHVVVNPSSNEIQEKIYGPFREGHLCELFYHPLAKEYGILNVLKNGGELRIDTSLAYLHTRGI
ncbi:hypothetical protein ABFS83_02G073100 [Erythranthe nasuta]